MFKAIRGYVKTVPVVVFVQNNSPYIESENVINLKDLKLFLDTYENDVVLDDNQINEIAKMIKDSSIEITRDEHIFNIKYYKQVIQEREEEMSIAIETNTYPLCNSQMLRKGKLYYCSKCDFTFYL